LRLILAIELAGAESDRHRDRAGWGRPVFQGLRLFSATALKSRAPTQQVPLCLLLAFEDE
jgi:hypothetical protein